MKRFVLGVVVICWATIVFAAGNGGKVTGTLSGKMNKAPVEFATSFVRGNNPKTCDGSYDRFYRMLSSGRCANGSLLSGG